MGFFFVATKRQSEDGTAVCLFGDAGLFVAAADAADKRGVTGRDVRLAPKSGSIAASH